jgi:hypothetical protein
MKNDVLSRIMGANMLEVIKEESVVGQLIKTERMEERMEYARSLALRLVRHRFGTVDDDFTSRINSLSAARADALTEAVLDFNSLDDLKNWLNAEPVN